MRVNGLHGFIWDVKDARFNAPDSAGFGGKTSYFAFCVNSTLVLESSILAFFASAINTLQTLVVALGAGLGVWGAINLLEGYGNDNPGAKSQGMKHVIPK